MSSKSPLPLLSRPSRCHALLSLLLHCFPHAFLSAHCAAATRKRPSVPGSRRKKFYLPREGGWSESFTDKVTLRQFPKINRSLPTQEAKMEVPRQAISGRCKNIQMNSTQLGMSGGCFTCVGGEWGKLGRGQQMRFDGWKGVRWEGPCMPSLERCPRIPWP